MKHIKLFENFTEETTDVKNKIKNSQKIPEQYKEDAISLLQKYSRYKDGFVRELSLHPLLLKKIKEKDLPSGFSMGLCDKGWFIHTQRAKSNTYKNPQDIPEKEIIFIDSTG